MAADAARSLRGAVLQESFEVGCPTTQRAAEPDSVAPPPAPTAQAVFKVMLRKHVRTAWKRKRLLTAVWPALLYGGVCITLYYAFDAITTSRLKYLLLAIIVPIYLLLGISGVLQNSIVEIVSEKESKMKVIQQIYGLSPLMYWVSWAAYFTIVSLVCITVLVVMLCVVVPVVAKANILLVITIFLISYMQQFETAAILSVFFSKVQSASSLAALLNLVLLLGSSFLQGYMRDKPHFWWYVAGLLPTVNVYNGLSTLVWLEADQGLTFQNLMTDKVCLQRDDTGVCLMSEPVFPAGEALLLMAVDVVLYGFLAWWLDNVWQGEFGAAKPLTFCLRADFWSRRPQQALGGQGAPLAMSIRNLRKVFKGKAAVDDMSLDVYPREIFALLGHNGAGKTTAINCVVGLIPMTAGEVTVNGFDVKTNLELARRQLSVCPQDNPLYDVFTVEQHLIFFAKLRGVSEEQVTSRIHIVLSALGMPEKVKDLCTSLSGGQKRRLWVATALLGESPVMFLDEPTSGLDPSSRRELWNILLQMKVDGRSIMFTTHYLEEADLLADRKAVVARGRVRAVGTSRDLKMQFGIGYHLQVELLRGAGEQQEAVVADLVRKHVPSAGIEQAANEERAQAADAPHFIRSTLPFQDVALFGPLLVELDSLKSSGGELVLRDYSIAMTSLEEVFMALGEQAEREAGNADNADFRDIAPEAEDTAEYQTSDLRGMKAIMLIRARQLLGNRRSIQSVFIFPAVLIVLAFNLRTGGGQNDTFLAIYPPMAFAISAITFTLHIIQDKQWKCKYVSLAQGLSVPSYWMGTFFLHYLALLPVGILLFVMAVINRGDSQYGHALPLIAVEVLLFPVGLLLYAYNFSLLFNSVEVAVKVLPLSNLFLATGPIMLVQFLPASGSWPDIVKMFHILMSAINPFYGLPGLVVWMSRDAANLSTMSDYLTSLCSLPVYCSPVIWLLYGGHLLWQDSRSYSSQPGDFKAFDGARKDEDVLAEEARIASTPDADGSEAARYQNLSHTYKTKVQGSWLETHAVRDISLGIRAGECFGLLGPNGAGKTTTLAVLTGEVRPPSAGRVTIFGHDVASAHGLMESYKLLGVCPQVDPLWESITGREHLRYYGRIKGVPEVNLEATVVALLYRLGLDAADGDKPAGTYSGGMKRKLSLGIALIGRRRLLFLDEPSAAVDAGAKRHLWKVIKMRSRTQTVVLTTHSMEEAEALCDRIAIQVKGQLRCLGSPNHIKAKYGSGYQLEIFCNAPSGSFAARAPPSQANALLDFIQAHLSPQCQLLEQHGSRYLFQLPPMDAKSSLTLGRVFTVLHSNKEDIGIADYSLMQPSLEQVFVRFAREQEEQEVSPEIPQHLADSASPLLLR